MPFSLIYVKYLEYINPKKSVAKSNFRSQEAFSYLTRTKELAKVITMDFVWGLGGDTCIDLSNRGHLGLGSLVATATEY